MNNKQKRAEWNKRKNYKEYNLFNITLSEAVNLGVDEYWHEVREKDLKAKRQQDFSNLISKVKKENGIGGD